MDWIESVMEIQRAQQSNRLVIFVGAGVSRNSGIPTWSELISKISSKIMYTHCDVCDKRPQCSDQIKKVCDKIRCFQSEEFMRIPEYFYQADSSDDKREYYDFIQQNLQSDLGSNLIDDEIFNVLPHHVITTNYDPLLENSLAANVQLYSVVSRDEDLLSKASDRYIIKMHGTLDDMKSIVLKESDYIDFEQKHPLISTFIRSLLINHTFLFLGYSLNDNNLNLIIGWINYFKEKYSIHSRPHNFLLQSEDTSVFEKTRLQSKNINVVNLQTMPAELVESLPASTLPSDVGKRLFLFLRCINNASVFQKYISLHDILEKRYALLKSYRKISYEDLLGVYCLGRTEMYCSTLVFYDREWYERIADLINLKDDVVLFTFQRAGISAIQFFPDDTCVEIAQPEETDNLFQMDIDDDYCAILKCLEKSNNMAEKIYYSILVGDTSEIPLFIEIESREVSRMDFVSLILHKTRAWLASLTPFNRQADITEQLRQLFKTMPAEYQYAVGYLKMLFESSASNMLIMQDLLEKQESRYAYKINGFQTGHGHTYIWKLQAYAYNYYFFFKKNYLPLCYYKDAKDYLSPYIKAILCSYSLVESRTDDDFFISTHREPYILNEIDFDIITKYASPDSLRSWIKKYSIAKIELLEEIDVVKKLRNLCDSYVERAIRYWPEQIHNFAIIISLLPQNDAEKLDAYNILSSAFARASYKDPECGAVLLEPLYTVIRSISADRNEETDRLVLSTLIEDSVYTSNWTHNNSILSYIIKRLSPSWPVASQISLAEEIDSLTDKAEKAKRIIRFLRLLPQMRYKEFLTENLPIIRTDDLFRLLVDHAIDFNETVESIFVSTINLEHIKRVTHPEERSYPDWLSRTINESLILYLLGFDFNISQLEPYSCYSEPLQCMLSPDTFDYSNVDTSNYMWQNLIYSEKYKHYFIQNKADILSEKMKTVFAASRETKEQQKIVYGVLLDDNELREF